MKTKQYFISWNGFDDKRRHVCFGATGVVFKTQEEEELKELGINKYIHKLAKEENEDVVSVQIIAFNQV